MKKLILMALIATGLNTNAESLVECLNRFNQPLAELYERQAADPYLDIDYVSKDEVCLVKGNLSISCIPVTHDEDLCF